MNNHSCLLLIVIRKILTIFVNNASISYNLNNKEIIAHPFFDGKNKLKNAWKWRNIKVSKIDEEFILSYETTNWKNSKIFYWKSPDLVNWSQIKFDQEPEYSFCLIQDYQYDQSEIGYFEKEGKILYYSFQNFQRQGFPKETDLMTTPGHFDSNQIFPIKAYSTKSGIFLFYCGYNQAKNLGIGLALINKNNPSQVLWKTKNPLWESNSKKKEYSPLGIVKESNGYKFYCKDQNENLYKTTLPSVYCEQDFFEFQGLKKQSEKKLYPNLKKSKKIPSSLLEQKKSGNAMDLLIQPLFGLITKFI